MDTHTHTLTLTHTVSVLRWQTKGYQRSIDPNHLRQVGWAILIHGLVYTFEESDLVSVYFTNEINFHHHRRLDSTGRYPPVALPPPAPAHLPLSLPRPHTVPPPLTPSSLPRVLPSRRSAASPVHLPFPPTPPVYVCVCVCVCDEPGCFVCGHIDR